MPKHRESCDGRVCFTGLEIPAEIGHTLFQLARRPSGRAAPGIDPENYPRHLALPSAISTALPPTKSPRCCFRVNRKPFEVKVQGPVDFWRQEAAAAVVALRRAKPAPDRVCRAELERLMQRLGLDPEGAQIHPPHVTLARLHDASSQDVRGLSVGARLFFQARYLPAERFVLFSSRASTGGGPYVVEDSYAPQVRDGKRSPHHQLSSPGLTGRSSIPEAFVIETEEAAAYWIPRLSRVMTIETWGDALHTPSRNSRLAIFAALGAVRGGHAVDPARLVPCPLQSPCSPPARSRADPAQARARRKLWQRWKQRLSDYKPAAQAEPARPAVRRHGTRRRPRGPLYSRRGRPRQGPCLMGPVLPAEPGSRTSAARAFFHEFIGRGARSAFTATARNIARPARSPMAM